MLGINGYQLLDGGERRVFLWICCAFSCFLLHKILPICGMVFPLLNWATSVHQSGLDLNIIFKTSCLWFAHMGPHSPSLLYRPLLNIYPMSLLTNRLLPDYYMCYENI